MGVLVQVENGDKQFCELEVSCTHWEGSACTQSALLFSFKFVGGRGGRGGFFSFFLCSQQVPNVFPMGVPTRIALIPYVLRKVLPFSPI
jgi:hypothetical protein